MGYGDGGDASLGGVSTRVAGSGVMAPPSPLALPNAISDLDMQIGSLREKVGSLRSRLQPLLSSAQPSTDNAKVAPTRGGVSGAIYEAAAVLQSLNHELVDLLDRLEI